MNFFRIMILWCCILCISPLTKAEEDQDFLRGCALYQHGKGEPANYPEALAYFMKAAGRSHARSQFYVGRMYQLESSIGIDFEAAKKWYRLAGEKGDGGAWNNLGNIHRRTGGSNELVIECYTRAAELGDMQSAFSLGQGYRLGQFGLKIDPGKSLTYLQQAAELGQSEAASHVGAIYLDGWQSVMPDKLKAAYYFSLGTKQGNAWAMRSLDSLLRDPDFVKLADKATLLEWREIRQNYRKEVEQRVLPILAKVRVAFQAGDLRVARQIFDEAFERWMSASTFEDDYEYCSVIWDEAQIKGGRTHTLWSLFLYNYLYDHAIRQGNDHHLITTRINIQNCLIELGQYALLRQSIEVSKQLILRSEKVGIDAVLDRMKVGPDYQVLGAESLPVFVSQGNDGAITSGELILGPAMFLLENLADERLAVGDWEPALVIAKWWEKWNAAYGKPGVIARPAFPSCESELVQMPMAMRMKAFASLGLPEREAEAARQLVALNSNSYGGQRRLSAQLRLFELAVDQGQGAEIDLKELESLEEKIRRNIFVGSHTWKFAKLVRAKVIAKTRGLDEGLPLVREVLEETKDDVLAPLRLEALLVAAQLSLEAGVTDGVAETLSQALESARSRGLLLKEMRVYELYVLYLIATHQYDAAVEMQNRVIELIKALKLAPRLEGALAKLEEVLSLRQKSLAAAPSGDDESGQSPIGGDEDKRSNGSPSLQQPGMPKSSLTLQPQGIRTSPIGEEASSVFLLTNLSTRPAKAVLRLKSDQLRLIHEERQEDQVTVICRQQDEVGMGVGELDCKVDVLGGSQIPIVLIAEGKASKGEASVSISLLSDSPGPAAENVSQWVIQQAQEAETIAVVDAARLTDSNFALVPVFHHLGSKEAGRTAALRVIASEPTRVEGFSSDGTLLFVDAQGNGSFADAGDLIASDQMDRLSPVLKSGSESGLIALRYRPFAKSLTKRLEIRIETRELDNAGAWKLDVVDFLEP